MPMAIDNAEGEHLPRRLGRVTTRHYPSMTREARLAVPPCWWRSGACADFRRERGERLGMKDGSDMWDKGVSGR